MKANISNETTSFIMIPTVEVGGITNRIAKFTTNAPNKEIIRRNQKDLNISINSILFAVMFERFFSIPFHIVA